MLKLGKRIKIDCVLIIIFLVINVNGNDKNSIFFTNKNSNKRNWKNIKIELDWEKIDNQLKLINPFKLKTDNLGNIYIIDSGIPGIVKISKNGTFINKYGRGKGRGPGEFTKPHDFAITNNQKIFVLDVNNGTVTVFDEKGKLLNVFNGIYGTHITSIGENKFVIQRVSNKDLFLYYDEKGNIIKKFGEINNINSKNFNPFFDFFILNDGKNIYAVGINNNYLISFNIKGYKNYIKKMIDESKGTIKYQIKDTNLNNHFFVKHDINVLDVSIYKDNCYVLSFKESKRQNAVVMDRYDLKKGVYRDSFKFYKSDKTKGVISCIFYNKNIITIESLKNGHIAIKKYKIKFLEKND